MGRNSVGCRRYLETNDKRQDEAKESSTPHSAVRQGERSVHDFKAVVAQEVDLSVWQTLQAFGILKESLSAGVTKRKVWLRTFTSAIVCWIFGIWQAIHSLP